MLHNACGTGAVIANDVDLKRAVTLTHQVQKLASPSVGVSCLDGKSFGIAAHSRSSLYGLWPLAAPVMQDSLPHPAAGVSSPSCVFPDSPRGGMRWLRGGSE